MLCFLGRRNTGGELRLLFRITKHQLTGVLYKMLKREHLQDFNAVRHYLLDKTQHTIGGFGKMPGDVPGQYLPPLS